MDRRVAEQSDEVVDITDSVECYANGKSFECECGQGYGTEFSVRTMKCCSCQKIMVDFDSDEREAPSMDKGQATLSAF